MTIAPKLPKVPWFDGLTMTGAKTKIHRSETPKLPWFDRLTMTGAMTEFILHPSFPTIPSRGYFCLMNWLWVALGGAVGSCARFAMSLAWPFDGKGFPLTTLSVNLLGCLLIGLLAPLLPQGWPRLLLISGVLGGFTTYSGFGLETQMLLQEGRNGAALAYLLTTVLGGLICTAAGWKAAQFMNPSVS